MPMYNVEKYIGAALKSILVQTFQNFEVIVVNNGSTDNSPAILESYIPKFGGRLKISHIEINSGSPSPAYNRAVSLSRGKYIFVMDSDDLIIDTALETLYNFAEKFDADVVNMCNSFIFFSETEKAFPDAENLQVNNFFNNLKLKNPVFESGNMIERVQNICQYRLGRTAWQRFVRRDLLMENNITFPENTRIAMDTAWAVQILCCAQKILTIPNLLYVYRIVKNSISHTKTNFQENIPNTMKSMLIILNFMEEFLSKQKFFKENPQSGYAILNFFERACFGDLLHQTPDIPKDYDFFKFLKSECEKNFGEYGKILAYLCTTSNFSRSRFEMANRRNIELENKLKQLQGG